MMEDKKGSKLALAILGSKPKDDEDEAEEEGGSEKEIAAEELQSVLSTGSPKEVAEAFQSLVTLCS